MTTPAPAVRRSVFPEPMATEPLSEALHQTRHEHTGIECTGDPAAPLKTGCVLRSEAYAEAARLRALGVVSIDSLFGEFADACDGSPTLSGVEVVTAAAEVYARVVAGDDSAGVKYRVADLVFAVAALARTQGFTVEHALRERTRLESLVRGVRIDESSPLNPR